MFVKTKLTMLMDYGFPRSVGTTTAMLNGFRHSPQALLIVRDVSQAINLGLMRHQFTTIESIPESIMGCKRPILIDHIALDALVRDHDECVHKHYGVKIEALEKKIKKLEEELEAVGKKRGKIRVL